MMSRTMTRAPMRAAMLCATLLSAACWSQAAVARSYESVRARGALSICANPNALPFSTRAGARPGVQIELGQALAQQLGVEMMPVWIFGSSQLRRADCDVVMDAINDPQVQSETGLKLSRPYYRTGIVLAVRPDSPITAFSSLNGTTKVGVMVGSLTAMLLNTRGVAISVFGFEDEMMQALADKEIDAAAVSRAMAGYFTSNHPQLPLRVLALDAAEPQLTWTVSVGMMRPDEALRHAVDDALERLRADGTITRIYAKYGIATEAPGSLTSH
jgi:polar amino acid transport system substrate-binding protein